MSAPSAHPWLPTGLAALLVAGCATVPPAIPVPATPSSAPAAVPAAVRLAAPRDLAARAYLGLDPEATEFALTEVAGEVLVLDFFDMYCHVCQSGARRVNELFAEVQRRGLEARVKFLGLGVGNSPLEAATFQRKFDVPFPLFPDRKLAVTRTWDRVRVPSLLVLRRSAGRLEVHHRHVGVPSQPDALLETILRALEAGRAPTAGGSASHPAEGPTCPGSGLDCPPPPGDPAGES